jgi:hypothetical protein
MENLHLEIAKAIGSPIDPNLPAPMVISEIADVQTAEPGEDCWTFADDGNGDDVYVVDSNGAITVHKVSPAAATDVSFQHYNSKLEYILVKDVMDAKDQGALARKKAALARAMDKLEVKRILDACLALASQEVTQDSGEDVYSVILKMVQKIEDYGNNYVLLVSAEVRALMDAYDKDNATNFNYKVSIDELLSKKGVKVIKVSGTVDIGAGQVRLLAASKAILVAKDSTLAIGLPISFIRRKISPEIAQGMGIEVDGAQRGLIVANTPVIVAGTNTLGYGVYGYESIIEAVTNKRAIAWCGAIA